MDKRKNDYYLKLALSEISHRFSVKMLEAPVGTGILTMPLYETLSDADITYQNYFPDIMERARRQAEKWQIRNVRFVQGDVRTLPFEDSSVAFL